MAINADQLTRIAHFAKPERFEPFIPSLNDCFDRYTINTHLRQAHFLAQVMHESGEFRYMEEISDGYQYEHRKDLGNTEPGDGHKYKGRGAIQLTGRTNYVSYSQYKGVDFVALPELVAHPPYCIDVAGWYWSVKRHLNPFADEDHIDAITRAINGGLNGDKERRDYLERAKHVLGLT